MGERHEEQNALGGSQRFQSSLAPGQSANCKEGGTFPKFLGSQKRRGGKRVLLPSATPDSLAPWLLGLSRMNDFRDFFTFIDESQRSGIEAET